DGHAPAAVIGQLPLLQQVLLWGHLWVAASLSSLFHLRFSSFASRWARLFGPPQSLSDAPAGAAVRAQNGPIHSLHILYLINMLPVGLPALAAGHLNKILLIALGAQQFFFCCLQLLHLLPEILVRLPALGAGHLEILPLGT